MKRIIKAAVLGALLVTNLHCGKTAELHPGEIPLETDYVIPPTSPELELRRARMAAANRPTQVLFLNFDGASIKPGNYQTGEAQNNTSFMARAPASVVPPFDASRFGVDKTTAINEVVRLVAENYKNYNVRVVSTRPASGNYTMMMIGGENTLLGSGWGGAIGLAPMDSGNGNPNDVGFVFSNGLSNYTRALDRLAYCITHEAGHSFGLQHITPTNDIMNAVLGMGKLIWGAGPLTDRPSETQDDNAVLNSNVGKAAISPPITPTPPPPPVPAKTFPLSGGELGAAIYRPTTSQWAVSGGWGLYGYGGDASDVPVPADYDRTGYAQVAVYRIATAQWFISGRSTPIQFGAANVDVPYPGDYDGTGRAQLAVYRPTTAEWFIAGRAPIQFGAANTDIPVPGDYDGSGRLQLAVYRPSTAQWFIAGRAPIQFGRANVDVPVPGDYNGTGRLQLAVYRPTTAEWFVQGNAVAQFGAAKTDVPVPADYNGVGRTQIAVYRPSTAQWFVAGAKAGVAFGAANLDIPLNGPLFTWRALKGWNRARNPFIDSLKPQLSR